MTSPIEAVYDAAARAYDRAVNDTLRNPPGYVLGDSARSRLVEMAHFRAAVDSAFAAGVAAGRAQAARMHAKIQAETFKLAANALAEPLTDHEGPVVDIAQIGLDIAVKALRAMAAEADRLAAGGEPRG